MNADHFYPSQCTLGESPFYDQENGSLYWVDIEGGRLFKFDFQEGKVNTWDFNGRLPMVLKGQKGQLILAKDNSLMRFDEKSGKVQDLLSVDDDNPEIRFNDGKCDAHGRLWAGTMSTKITHGVGSLYKIDSNLKPKKMIEGVTISNGMAWNQDQKTFYYIDSPSQQILVYDFDLEKGEISIGSVAVKISKDLGTPDGMCIDKEGMLWVAHYGGGGIFRWNPNNGKLLQKVIVPAPHVTSCCFGGEKLSTLYITTAKENLSADQLKAFPLSGDVFCVETDTEGFLANLCQF